MDLSHLNFGYDPPVPLELDDDEGPARNANRYARNY